MGHFLGYPLPLEVLSCNQHTDSENVGSLMDLQCSCRRCERGRRPWDVKQCEVDQPWGSGLTGKREGVTVSWRLSRRCELLIVFKIPTTGPRSFRPFKLCTLYHNRCRRLPAALHINNSARYILRLGYRTQCSEGISAGPGIPNGLLLVGSRVRVSSRQLNHHPPTPG